MIPFFRRIRHKLANDNQFLKYSRYAIGEIILVVIGILIALSINNWNEERLKKNALQERLKNLAENLDQDVGGLTIWKNIHEFRFHAMQHLLTISGHEPNYFPDFENNTYFIPKDQWISGWKGEIPNQYDAEFVKVAIRHIDVLSELQPNSSVLEEIKDDGLYSFFEDPDLTKAVDNYYLNYERRLGASENENIRKYKNDWIDAMNLKGFHAENISDSQEVIQWLENSPQATANLRNLASNAKWRYDSSDVLIKEAKQLIEEINTYLGQNN